VDEDRQDLLGHKEWADHDALLGGLSFQASSAAEKVCDDTESHKVPTSIITAEDRLTNLLIFFVNLVPAERTPDQRFTI
jgi:hypothetical protein